MEKNESNSELHKSGSEPGIGVYICTQCHFAIVVMRENFVLPTCPCCENDTFVYSEEGEEFDE